MPKVNNNTEENMKKIIAIIVAFVVVAGVGLGVFFIMNGKGKEDEAKTLRIWSAPPLMGENYEDILKIDPTNYSALYSRYVIEKFKEEYPDVTIRYEAKGWAEQLNENIVRSANVSQPDIIGTETYTQNLIDLDYLSPVDWGEKYDNFLPFTLESSTREGKLYATPVYTNVCAFLYNETMLVNAGCPTTINDEGKVELIVPETWAEVLYCCQLVDAYLNSAAFLGEDRTMTAIEKAKYGAYIINNESGIAAGFRGELYLQIAGGSMIKDGSLSRAITDKEIDLDTKENENGFALMSTLYGYSPTGAYTLAESNVSTALLSGDVAMTLDIPAWLEAGAAAGVNIKAAAVPVLTYDQNGDAVLEPYRYSETNRDGVNNSNTKEERANIAVGNVSYAITKKSEKKEMAQKFIEICLSEEAQAYLLALNYRSPSTKSGLEYVLDDDSLSSLSASMGDSVYQAAVKNRGTMYPTLIAELNSVSGNGAITGGLACFSKNINRCWTHYETFMRQIYNDRSARPSKQDIRTALTALSDNIKGELK